jgi:protein-S-isoprenylcysteine O-methyltransferase Ste14
LTGLSRDAPKFRVWPPVALGIPWLAGFVLTVSLDDPFNLPATETRLAAAVLLSAFVVWNGWTLAVMASNRTAILPGQATTRLLRTGPFQFSRNPLYIGLIALDLGASLLWPSAWALLLVPVGVAILRWGAISPEEHYLHDKFGAAYDEYRRQVRRWL